MVVTAVWVVFLALLSTGVAVAQDDQVEGDEAPVEIAYYGDTKLIDTLRTYGLLDEWIAASPVSPQASLLRVSGNAGYQSQRQSFLNSVEAWADRTERVREDLARIETAQANADRLRSIVVQVRDALVFDDRLATESKTLVEIQDGLDRLPVVEVSDEGSTVSEDPLTLAEAQLGGLRERVETELTALNGVEPAFTVSGIAAFVGFEQLRVDLNAVDQLIARSRELVKPAQEDSERLVSSALSQIPSLHSARMLGATDAGGLSVVTVDAYIRAAARASCSIDWALLAGIGQIESNHGRLGGASVSRSGKVSTTILGPLLDGGATERDALARQFDEGQWAAITEAVRSIQLAVQAAVENSSLDESGDRADASAAEASGNGFAVVVDSDGGRLDGNEQWDRAIGPMQFIPETWSKWATDGNGDGATDPHNLYDAAASAARFLCDLRANRGPSPSTFLLGYNSSSSYVRNVVSAAQGFRAMSLPDV